MKLKLKLTQDEPNALFDAPGPKAKARQGVYTVITLVAFLGLLVYVYLALDAKGQWAGNKWAPFIDPATWTDYAIPGLLNTLMAAAQASVLAVVFGLIFGIGRMSEHWWLRLPSAAVVEFFRGIPLLMLIFFTMALPLAVSQLIGVPAGFRVEPLTAVVVGLTLYNGSVLAEVFRAGILAVPRGQSEAAYSLGMNKTKVMTLILVPQGIASMMPAIVAQLVVLLKDSALGSIVSYPELLRNFSLIGTGNNNIIPAAIVCAVIYIAINLALSRLAIWLERRNAQRGKASAAVTGVPGMDTSAVSALGATGQSQAAAATATTATAGPPDSPEPTLRDPRGDGPPAPGADGPGGPGPSGRA